MHQVTKDSSSKWNRTSTGVWSMAVLKLLLRDMNTIRFLCQNLLRQSPKEKHNLHRWSQVWLEFVGLWNIGLSFNIMNNVAEIGVPASHTTIVSNIKFWIAVAGNLQSTKNRVFYTISLSSFISGHNKVFYQEKNSVSLITRQNNIN